MRRRLEIEAILQRSRRRKGSPEEVVRLVLSLCPSGRYAAGGFRFFISTLLLEEVTLAQEDMELKRDLAEE
jgi:hypothetical protein